MPTIGGVTGDWDEEAPTNKSNVSDGNEHIQSIKTNLRTGLDAEHNWPSASGSGFGYHVQGSARPFYGVQSAVSSSGSDARLMLTSDTSRLFGSGSAGTIFFGGPTVPLMGSYPGAVPQRHQWVEEIGIASNFASSGSTVVTFPNSGFSGLPYVFLTVVGGGASDAFKTASITTTPNAFTPTQMTVVLYDSNALLYSTGSVFWRSIGTRAT